MLSEPRRALRPVEYPAFLGYRDAIRHSYWLHTEFHLTEDVHDFRARVSAGERALIERTMLAIAQVEVAVKTFWGDLYHRFPKPEVGAVGYTFAESEVRHQDAYAHLLELLGLEAAFEGLDRVPAVRLRLETLHDHLQPAIATADPAQAGRTQARTLLLFSVFVEHVSLFGQFLVMKAFDRHRGLFKGIANIVEATSKEEQVHGLFGHALLATLRQERPAWFDAAFDADVQQACHDFLAAERGMLDWLFEHGEPDFLPRAQVDAFLRGRMAASLRAAGHPPAWTVPPAELDPSAWFDEELLAGKHVDFFHKRPTGYAKKARPIRADDLFGPGGG